MIRKPMIQRMMNSEVLFLSESRRRKDRRNELPKVIEPKPAVIYPESDGKSLIRW